MFSFNTATLCNIHMHSKITSHSKNVGNSSYASNSMTDSITRYY
jgi:hypothetical protein